MGRAARGVGRPEHLQVTHHHIHLVFLLSQFVRFWLRQAALSCEGDRCWRHLLHPLPGNLPPEQTAQVPQRSNLIPTAAGDRVGDPGAAHHSIGPLLFLAFNLICLNLKLENVHFSSSVCTSCDLFSRKYPLCIAPTDPGNVR